jgi:hypothetical protein
MSNRTYLSTTITQFCYICEQIGINTEKNNAGSSRAFNFGHVGCQGQHWSVKSGFPDMIASGSIWTSIPGLHNYIMPIICDVHSWIITGRMRKEINKCLIPQVRVTHCKMYRCWTKVSWSLPHKSLHHVCNVFAKGIYWNSARSIMEHAVAIGDRGLTWSTSSSFGVPSLS